jgi:PAS domain S-box-containing protein
MVNNELLLHSFVEGTSDLIFSIRSDGSFEFVNSAWLDTFQYSRKELDNLKILDIVFPGYRRRTEESITRIFEGHKLTDYVSTYVSKLGTPVQVEGRMFPQYENDKVTTVGVILSNITNQNRMIEEIQHEQNRVEYLMDLITHDLTNINQELLTALEVALYSSDLSSSLESMLRESLIEVERGSNLLYNVKQLMKIAKRPPRMKSCDVIETILAARDIIEKTFTNKEIALETNLDQSTYFVIADEYLLEVFKSLFYNALRFDSRDKIKIEIEAAIVPHTNFVIIQFKDYGTGVQDVEKSMVFEKLTEKQRGLKRMGLGLTLTKHVIENYGGYIRVEDRVLGQPKEGANFILLLRLSKIDTLESSKFGGS